MPSHTVRQGVPVTAVAQPTLDEFLFAIFGQPPENEVVVLTAARPDQNGRTIFPARPWRPGRTRVQGSDYYCISTVRPAQPGGKLQRTISDVVATCVIVLDDIGTKIAVSKFADKAVPHYIIETSPGNFQYGYILQPSDPSCAAAVIHALALAGFTDVGAQGKNRVVRVPGSVNTKREPHFVARIVAWNLDQPLWELDDICAEFGVEPIADAEGSSIDRPSYRGAATADPVYEWLQSQGMVLGPPNQDGYASITCPWSAEHSDPRDDARWAVGAGLTGAFKCFHAACNHRATRDLLGWIEESGGPDFAAISAEQVSALGVKLLAIAPPGLVRKTARARLPERRPPKVDGAGPNPAPEPVQADKAPALPPDVTALLTAILDSLPALLREQLPTVDRTAGGGVKAEQRPTAENVGWVAQETGFVVRKNELSGEVEIEFDHPSLDAFKSQIDRHRLVRELLISVCQRVGISVRATLQASLDALASGNGYHPILDWVRSVKWDGVDRLTALADTLVVSDENRAWVRTAVRRWCIQGVAAWSNWERQPAVAVPFVLTLVGGQGIGKTSWFRSLLPNGQVQTEAALHLDSMRADDQKRKVLSSAIVELGELETTLGRSEIGALKAFLSNTTDRYRMPYDRDVTIRTRCTIFGASVNEFEFLLDTSNRRFWPCHVTGVNWRHGIDTQQLWAQAAHLLASGETWNLDEDEGAAHAVVAERHRVIGYAESLLDELNARVATIDRSEWSFASSAEIGKYYRLDTNSANWRAVGRALRNLFGEPRASSGKRGWQVPIRRHEFVSGYVSYNPLPNLRVVK